MTPERISSLVIHGITDPNTLICISRARRFSQYCKMVKTALSDHPCPFCPPLDPKYNNVQWESPFWLAWQSSSPEKSTLHHIIIVPRQHATDTSQLNEVEWGNLFAIIQEIKKELCITSCGLMCRDGDATKSAGTIQHLHWHLMVPDGKGRVESPFYKGDEADEKSLAQALVFEKLRRATNGCITDGVTKTGAGIAGFNESETAEAVHMYEKAYAALTDEERKTVEGILD